MQSELEEVKSSNGSVTEEMEALSSRLKMAVEEKAEISQKEAQLQGIVKEVGVMHCAHFEIFLPHFRQSAYFIGPSNEMN